MVALLTHLRETHKMLRHTMTKGPDELGQTSSPQRHPPLLVTLAPVVPSIRVPRGNPPGTSPGQGLVPRVSSCPCPSTRSLCKATWYVPLKSLDSIWAGDILGASGEAARHLLTALTLFLQSSF